MTPWLTTVDADQTCCSVCDGLAGVRRLRIPSTDRVNAAAALYLCVGCRGLLIEQLAGDVEQQRARSHAEMLRWRHIDPGDECERCEGTGWKLYGSTATWRGGMGGAAMTRDVCDACWGSGDRWRHGCDLRRLRDEEGARVAEAAVDALARSCGATMNTTRPQIAVLVQLLRDEVAKVDGPRRRPTGARDSIWYSPLVKGLADLLERALRGAR